MHVLEKMREFCNASLELPTNGERKQKFKLLSASSMRIFFGYDFSFSPRRNRKEIFFYSMINFLHEILCAGGMWKRGFGENC